MSQSDAVLTRDDSVQRGAGRFRGPLRLSRLVRHPLLAVLAVQAVVSGRLAWVNAAFGDEANYLSQGHVEWRDWLQGIPVPAMHDSGAPQLYPVIGAAASALGGLPLARLLSLAFMLGATALVYATAHRLFGRTAAVWAAALGAFNEPVLRLTFATFDPLSILLLMAGCYLAVRSATARRGGEMVAAAGVCLLLSALVAVSFAIYIPVVMALMLCTWAERKGWSSAVVPVIWQFVLIGALAVIGVSQLHVWSDFVANTVDRTSGLGAAVSSVLTAAWGWGGLVLCVAVAGAVLAFASYGCRHPSAWLVLVLALADVVVPVYQVYIGTAYSMDKHLAAGAELAAIAGGFAISRVGVRVRAGAPRGVAAFAMSAALLMLPLVSGVLAADSTFGQWPDTRPLAAELRGLLAAARTSAGSAGSAGAVSALGPNPPGPGSLLVDPQGPANFNPATFTYYLPNTDVRAASGGNPTFPAAIKAGLYSVAVQDLNSTVIAAAARQGGLTPALRSAILAAEKQNNDKVAADLIASHRYALTDVLPYVTNTGTNPSGVFVIWTVVSAPAPAP
jgi:hypothetical protein